ncbi:MAG: BlaI/MecI/CopY family transcriptional regulator [bacterium]
MAKNPHETLSRRERQIMDIVYRLGRATVNDVLVNLPDPPGYSGVRAHLRILEQKGHLHHETDGARYIYSPRVSRERARKSALHNLLHNFFDGSREQLIATLLDSSATELADTELENLARLIDQARLEGR